MESLLLLLIIAHNIRAMFEHAVGSPSAASNASIATCEAVFGAKRGALTSPKALHQHREVIPSRVAKRMRPPLSDCRCLCVCVCVSRSLPCPDTAGREQPQSNGLRHRPAMRKGHRAATSHIRNRARNLACPESAHNCHKAAPHERCTVRLRESP